ncbi:MAG TPA: choice-of-anchor tandem repeat GloVer-containing protein [Bryobacteraceae bacterium]|jgi:uncharacterized repeat protein (TIGR03803 family)|nr:choice-of-anchor tandem repeat GloVer-containing protein [Bryobacteraceae bacterium]
MKTTRVARNISLLGLPVCLWTVAAIGAAQAQPAVEHIIHTFGNFSNGASPYGTPVLDPSGNLYGTTYQGGAANLGVVFRTGNAGYKVLHSFKGGTDGANPYTGATLDPAGNLYGTTYQGGAANAGVVYKVTPAGQETVLYSFTGAADGANPYAGVILDSAGNVPAAAIASVGQDSSPAAGLQTRRFTGPGRALDWVI